MPNHSLLLLLVTLAFAALTNADITGYSNTLSSNVAGATGVISSYTFTPLSGVAKAFRSIKMTNQGFSAASSPLTGTCSNLLSVPSASISTAVGASQTAEFTFKTSTELVVDRKITLTFPASLLTAVATATSCELVPSPAVASVTDGATANLIKITVKSIVPAGSIKITCSGLTFAAKTAVLSTPSNTDGVKIETETDTVAAYMSTPAVGAVSSVSATLSRTVGASQTASISFSTSSNLPVGDKITVAFPGGLVSSVVSGSTFCELVPKPSAASSAAFSSDAVVITVNTAVSAGKVTVTCSGLTFATRSATVGGLSVQTTVDTIVGTADTSAVGAVTAVAASALTMSRVVGSSQAATIAFTTSTELSSGGQITFTFPSSVITSVTPATSFCGVKGVASSASFASKKITVTLGATLAASSVTVTCSGLTLAAAAAVTATSSTGLKIETSKDSIAAYVSIPAVGTVTIPSASLSTAVGTTGTASVSFTTSTTLAAGSGNQIMITFPSDLVTANAENKCSITSPATKATSAFASGVVTISLDTTATLVAGTVTVKCTDLTLAAKAAVTNGVEIKTSKDTVAAYVNTPAVGAITADAASALTLSKGVGATGTATIQFTTSTSIAAHPTANKVTLTFPTGHVTAATADKCAISSPTTAAGNSAYATNAITITLSATSTLAAGAVTVTCTGLTLAAKEAVTATATAGLKIETNKDTVAAFVSVPAVGAITADAASALTLSKGVGATGTATIQFTTSTSIAIATGNKVTLTFPTGHVTGGTGCGISSPATVTGTVTYAANVIEIPFAASALAAGAVTVTCTGLTLAAKAAVTATATAGLKIETNIDTVAAFVSVPAVGAVSVEFVSGSSTSFTGTLADNKDLTLTSSGDVWTVSSAPSVSCSVSSFTNAALVSTQASNPVIISVLDAAGNAVYTATTTDQEFPTTVAAPSPRTLYLPKAAGSSYKVACALAVISALLAFL